MAPTYEQIRTERRDRVLVVTLHRPEKLNAWTPQMMAELVSAIGTANDDETDAPGRSGDETDPTFGLPDTVIFTSATVPTALVERLRIPPDEVKVIDVGTPFDFANHALLYCATHMPDPRSAKYADAVADELVKLIEAAGGRTLALFTSHRAMNEAADAVSARVDLPVLRQGDLVTALNGQPITTSRALVRGVAGLPPGETVRLTLTRGGRQQDIAVQIGRRPNDNQG